jgi:hypothetical protein
MDDFKPSLKFFIADIVLLVLVVAAYHMCV